MNAPEAGINSRNTANNIVNVDKRCWPSTTNDFGSLSSLIRTMLPRKYWLLVPETRACQRRLNIDPPCRSKIDPGRVAEI